jgi:hypothetical protein
MAKKTLTRKKATANPTAHQILAMWTKAIKAGLGLGKRLDQSIVTEFEAALLRSIQKQLDAGSDFSKAKKGTLIVAKDVGRVCRMLTKGGTVTKAVFVDVFKLVRHHHPACPLPAGGAGVWCDSGA